MIAAAAAPGRSAETDGTPRLPSRQVPRGHATLRALFDARPPTASLEEDGAARGGLGPMLIRAYDGDLIIPLRADRATVVANFVETLDGVVALDASGASGGGEVSGFNPADRFVMAILRALADAVLVGAGTVRASEGGGWTAQRLRPDLAEEFAALRRRLGLRPNPTTIVVTSSGHLDPDHRGLRDPEVPVVIVAPEVAADRLEALRWPAHVRIERIPPEEDLPAAVADVAGRIDARLVLSEAGPHVTATLLKAGRIDELFLTLAPQVAGRAAGVERLSLVEGTGLWPADPRWLGLRSVRQGGDHLFLRYAAQEADHDA